MEQIPPDALPDSSPLIRISVQEDAETQKSKAMVRVVAPARRWRQHSVGNESLECIANSSRQLHPGRAMSMARCGRVDVNSHNDKTNNNQRRYGLPAW